MIKNPEFIVHCGPMFSSKTTALLMTLERFTYQNKVIAAFKPKIDDRYSVNEIVSHNGFKYPAREITAGADIFQYLSSPDVKEPTVIAVDEAFMIPGIADALIWLYRNGFTVVVSSLDISSSGKIFSEIEKILPWATKVDKCSAVCTVCGSDAHYTHRKVAGGEEIEIGGAASYEPRCLTHHVGIVLRVV
jgi:thymidine kinase